MRDGSGATAQLAEWVHGMQTATLDAAVAHQVSRLVLDCLGAAIAGSATEVAGAVRDLVAGMYPGDHASVIGGGRASAAGAALANGTAAHALDIDDGYTPGSVHPSAPAVPAVLAAAQHTGAPAETVLRAVAAAVEVTCRVARSAHPATREAGFHNTALAGVLGAAAGVSVVLGLDRAEVASALGVAGSHSGGLFEFLGSGAEVKRLHAGKAARDGLLSAHFARLGVTGPATVLEGTNGYFRAFAGGAWRPGALLDGLGEHWALRDTYVKVHACCRHLHGAIDALLDLRAEHDLSGVTAVRVETYAIAAGHAHTTFDSHLDAQMSLPYAVAVTLLDGKAGLAQFDAAHRASPAVAELAALVEVVAEAGLDARYPAERPARVTVHRAGRPPLCREVGQPRGEPSRPLDDDELTAKFRLLADPVVGPHRAARIAAAVWAFDDVTAVLGELADQQEGKTR
ncbi:2-methylcitrate dehydratase [Amycolatopsis mediterranei S699]|uniref:2-methylcitrate dehydratase n=2 Tax=Amycolatopsis mediterranei TaxID=33910 RepID=A0A0H3D5Q3_AMYMU|nr:MmgE/PrpD family protein [Amycolatopsis mediterranei]ADJ45622.1 2-methylcitrate dehydratase [Amycolatopsis mediterranei U32]AEK42401.1 2-methylcitrate dehydratase [Amycolatopsis mediterranei S699]AFO77334.1 2-methylcitrate dehydratase [Amycolatopsis mediterranei S699]AGT84462.1 2-methylcitrate dehydratase [Amycolatopsis mediterranei RB]KDO05878.1 2-methylcitrate dehydratase [Amycolatopsis mediterranei]